ncbi:hypothetical protein SAMN05216353_10383 [Halobacillus alkaliphilus]|uniref:Lipoprotein n=1 Tax=Halobacillus alkaliphilus TaxID=396056 RepID=A0A1I2K509_9BACI|nr:hypothetical protein [Halobacillus alkaliphilus]SFF61270.1 hypothetical protein SAMN05216353_10383 [Halobacillus alkaliphilus]
MKKWVLMLGIAGTLVIAGCNNDSSDESSSDSENQTEEQSSGEEESKNDDQAMKKEIMSVQMNMQDTFHPYQSKIAAYEEALVAEEPDPEAIKSAGEEAQKAAAEAADAASSYSIEADLPEDVITTYEEALPSLQSYYEEVASALESNVEEADLSQADEKFSEFTEQIAPVYEDAGLLKPEFKKEFS